MWSFVFPILTLLLGLVGGFFGGIFYLKNQMLKMSLDDKQLQTMAKSMGMDLNPKQLAQASKAMKNMQKSKSFKFK